ncbi:MAG: glycosyltransferase family 4 protein [Anaerolineae bacterium]|nr:glycosyltransferase family 4 protein [Anaerolineae bacterium]
MSKGKLAFVIQRYGEDLVGGSESLCRSVAEMLSPDWDIEVLTSCAKDYVSWKNEYAPGVNVVNGVPVRRFPVDFERGQSFHDVFGSILGGMPAEAYHRHKPMMRQAIARASTERQLECLRLEGPYSTPFFEYIAENHSRYDLVVFFTYLYAQAFFGVQKVPAEKTVLVPTAHDEAVIAFPVFRPMFERFPAFVFLTPEERDFVHTTFDLDDVLEATIGMPVELDSRPNPDRFREKYHIRDPFVLYAGRIDAAKGCDHLFRFFSVARPHLAPGLQLLLMGKQAMVVPKDPHIRYLGRLSEQDKLDAMAAASVLINPSFFESFSIVILEAMACGTPVLVNGRCDVLKGQVRRSSAGLYYENYYEFLETLRLMLSDESLRLKMGENGREFVAQNYRQAIVAQCYDNFFRRAIQKCAESRGD